MGIATNSHDEHGVERKSRGRGIYFFHDGTTKLPVRDVTDRYKKEPHIEYGFERDLNDDRVIGAENFCYPCYPAAIRKLVEHNEAYLFLTTNPKHPDIPYNENLIVGYIRNDGHEPRDGGRFAVIGEVKLFSFDDALPANEFGKRVKGPLGKWGETYTEQQTEEILDHFDGCYEVTESCVEKVLELEEGKNSQKDSGCGC